MPRKTTDYAKALIYKICCLDPLVKEIYVGSTTDIIRRRYNHKTACNNPNSKNYNLKVYKHIRQHGGWDNWKMILIEYFPCETELQLGKNEDHWKQELQASLNSVSPPMYATKKDWLDAHPEYHAEYYKTNRQQINDRQKDWRDANRQQIAEHKKEYYEANREQIIDRSTEYNKVNREQIKKKKDEKHACECGGKFTHGNKSIHLKSNKHQKHLEEKNKINKISA